MANIAQTINVLQAMILTDKEKMILTPTYHVFDMFQQFQDATHLPLELTSKKYSVGANKMNAISASAALAKNGKVIISLVNVDATKSTDVSCELKGIETGEISGQILTAESLNAHNTFDNSENIKVKDFTDVSVDDGKLLVKMPAKSIVVISINKK